VIANGGAPTVKVALTMFDYIFPELKNQSAVDILTDEQYNYITDIENQIDARVALIGTGPSTMAWVK
jgi:adenylosuccinate synthase